MGKIDKFWLWMDKKGYGERDKYNYYIRGFGINGVLIQPTEQMLIGPMFEYIFEQGAGIVTIPYEQQIKKDIHDLYEYLVKRIEEI